MSPRKFRNVEQLSKQDVMSKAFDDLLPFTGLWAPLQLGCLSRILAMKCEEEFRTRQPEPFGVYILCVWHRQQWWRIPVSKSDPISK
jgi:hypothetical protein